MGSTSAERGRGNIEATSLGAARSELKGSEVRDSAEVLEDE